MDIIFVCLNIFVILKDKRLTSQVRLLKENFN